ncbi:hypothetical protein OBBRIDRAFT_361625 [Obba rivulosa]|uniref:NADH dehydrogenase [ubiquinone] 1 alpha subcomplex subunit 11 n=1 Tax=Obba rivulosa TaxID=1052685 RepID=A0A8E2J6V9_9APHY|nr:hypothetical protein OBBRIDRAFT_361625 [Obba rivulosa]
MDTLPDSPTPSTTDPALYESKPSLQYAAKVGLQAAAVGTFVSAIQNALGQHSHGASGILTRSGGTIGFFAAMGATFALTESTVANYRERDDPLNGAAGACAAGFLAGIRARSLPMAVASCAVLGTIMGTYDYTGREFVGGNESLEERRKRFFKRPPPTEFVPAASE